MECQINAGRCRCRRARVIGGSARTKQIKPLHVVFLVRSTSKSSPWDPLQTLEVHALLMRVMLHLRGVQWAAPSTSKRSAQHVDSTRAVGPWCR